MECVAADFLQFSTKIRHTLAVGWRDGHSTSGPSISRIFLKFLNFLSLTLFGNSGDNSFIHFLTFHLWRRHIVLKTEDCSKEYRNMRTQMLMSIFQTFRLQYAILRNLFRKILFHELQNHSPRGVLCFGNSKGNTCTRVTF